MIENNIKSRKLKWIFSLLAISFLIPWPVAYAYDAGDDVLGQDAVQIKVADPTAAPSAKVFGKAIGGVTPGDLFYIDASENAADIEVTLYLTNAQELIHYYRYMIIKVGVYVESDTGEWEKALEANSQPIPDTFITMRNGQVSFTLPGYAKYRVTIDGGSLYSFTTNADEGSLSPQFYLDVD